MEKKKAIKKAIGTLWHLFSALSVIQQLIAIGFSSVTTYVTVNVTVVINMFNVDPWLIAVIFWIILFFSTIYAMGRYNLTKQAKEAVRKEEAEKERFKKSSLKSKLDEIIKYSFNNDNQSPLINKSIKLINHPKYPPEIEQKITEYNKKAEDLIDLFTGCGYLVIDMVIKNVLKHLSKIEVRRDDENNIIPWTMRDYGGEQKLSGLLSNVLKDRIINGVEINKSLFENIDSSFYGKVVQSPSSPEDFEYFLRDLGIDIKYQRQDGCLKLLARVHKEAEKLAKDLKDDKYLKMK